MIDVDARFTNLFNNWYKYREIVLQNTYDLSGSHGNSLPIYLAILALISIIKEVLEINSYFYTC